MGPYQVLPLRARVDIGAMAMKEYSAYSSNSIFTEASQSDYLVSYLGYSIGESYSFAEMQSVYSTAPIDWATN